MHIFEENTFWSKSTHSKRTHSIVREHILSEENTFYDTRTHAIVREHTFYSKRTHSKRTHMYISYKRTHMHACMHIHIHTHMHACMHHT